jgi:hypothetical protein
VSLCLCPLAFRSRQGEKFQHRTTWTVRRAHKRVLGGVAWDVDVKREWARGPCCRMQPIPQDVLDVVASLTKRKDKWKEYSRRRVEPTGRRGGRALALALALVRRECRVRACGCGGRWLSALYAVCQVTVCNTLSPQRINHLKKHASHAAHVYQCPSIVYARAWEYDTRLVPKDFTCTTHSAQARSWMHRTRRCAFAGVTRAVDVKDRRVYVVGATHASLAPPSPHLWQRFRAECLYCSRVTPFLVLPGANLEKKRHYQHLSEGG